MVTMDISRFGMVTMNISRFGMVTMDISRFGMVTKNISRFGMVTMETDVEELLALVLNTGRDIDEAVVQLQTMTEVVKRGVQQAQDELKRESDNQIWQEGILRLVIRYIKLKFDFRLKSFSYITAFS